MVVYLLHYDRDDGYGRHYLALAPSEGEISLTTVRHGRGVRLAPEGDQAPPMGVVADVWELPTADAARGLLLRLRKQGSRARLCSVCNPGNSRGSGGRWVDRKVTLSPPQP